MQFLLDILALIGGAAVINILFDAWKESSDKKFRKRFLREQCAQLEK